MKPTYRLEIKKGDPPAGQAHDGARLPFRELNDVASRIAPGQYIEGLSAGSLGRLARLIEQQGLRVIRRPLEGVSAGALYVPSRNWLNR